MSFTTEGIATISVLLVALSTCITFLFRLLLAAKDKQIAECNILNGVFRVMAEEAVRALEAVASKQRISRGENAREVPTPTPVSAFNIPAPTITEQKTAEVKALQARTTAALLDMSPPGGKP